MQERSPSDDDVPSESCKLIAPAETSRVKNLPIKARLHIYVRTAGLVSFQPTSRAYALFNTGASLPVE